MKTTTYRFAGMTFKASMRTVGQGWEVCVNRGKKTVFVGNFVHKADATKWWTTMNQEVRHFTRNYFKGMMGASTWTTTFFSNHLYKCYYKFLDKLFVKHTRTYTHAVTKNLRQYKTLRKSWGRGTHLTRAA